MEVRLRVTCGANADKEVIVPVSKFFIGRDPQCHLRPKSDAISRHHCALLISETQVALRDFGSKNGTHINGERVQDICILKPGDVLRVGPLEFEVLFKPPVSSKRPAVQSVKEVADRTASAAEVDEGSVADWLAESDQSEETTKDSQTGPETRMYRLDSTERMALEAAAKDDTQTFEATSETQTDSKADDSQAGKKKKKAKPGKLPKQLKDASGDSRSAANDALRRYFNRS